MERKISKTRIEKRLKRKTDSGLVRTILLAKKNNAWLQIAQLISAPRRKQASVNLERIERETTEGDTIVVPGKVLGQGKISKMVRVCALSFSKDAIKKLKETKSEIVNIEEEIRINPKAQGIKIIK